MSDKKAGKCTHVRDNGKICKLNSVINEEYCYRHAGADICPICFDPIRRGDKKILNCGHSFHTQCLLRWFVTGATCPVCRKSSSGDQWVQFRELVAEEMRERYKDAMDSMEREMLSLRRQLRRQARVISD
mgnify:CR=1 FL=1